VILAIQAPELRKVVTPIEMEATAYVIELKEYLAKVLGLDPGLQIIQVNGRVLDDLDDIGYGGIIDGSTVLCRSWHPQAFPLKSNPNPHTEPNPSRPLNLIRIYRPQVVNLSNKWPV